MALSAAVCVALASVARAACFSDADCLGGARGGCDPVSGNCCSQSCRRCHYHSWLVNGLLSARMECDACDHPLHEPVSENPWRCSYMGGQVCPWMTSNCGAGTWDLGCAGLQMSSVVDGNGMPHCCASPPTRNNADNCVDCDLSGACTACAATHELVLGVCVGPKDNGAACDPAHPAHCKSYACDPTARVCCAGGDLCAACAGPAGACAACSSGYYVNGDGGCAALPSGCPAAAPDGTCTSCWPGYYFVGSPATRCDPLPPSCSAASSDGDCSACYKPESWGDAGHYLDDGAPTRCATLPQMCAAATPDGACTACVATAGGAAIAYLNAATPARCAALPPNCAAAVADGSCTECVVRYAGAPVPEFYLTDDAPSACERVPEGCIMVDAAGCTECDRAARRYLDDDGHCPYMPDFCTDAASDGSCTACYDGFYLRAGAPVVCVRNPDNCAAWARDGECTACTSPVSYFLSDATDPRSCALKPPGCIEALHDGACTSCAPHAWYLHDGDPPRVRAAAARVRCRGGYWRVHLLRRRALRDRRRAGDVRADPRGVLRGHAGGRVHRVRRALGSACGGVCGAPRILYVARRGRHVRRVRARFRDQQLRRLRRVWRRGRGRGRRRRRRRWRRVRAPGGLHWHVPGLRLLRARRRGAWLYRVRHGHGRVRGVRRGVVLGPEFARVRAACSGRRCMWWRHRV